MTDVNDRNFKKQNEQHLAQATKNAIMEFVEVDNEFSGKLSAFMAKHADELLELDNLREKRNRVLDDATQRIRKDADLTPRTDADCLIFGPFNAQKKESETYLPDTFVAIAERTGHLKSMVDSGVVKTVTSIEFDNAERFLKANKLEKTFASAYDVKPLTTAVTGPKEIPPFGAPAKKK